MFERPRRPRLVTALSSVIGYDKASKIAHQTKDRGSALKRSVEEKEYDKVINLREMAGHGVGGAQITWSC